MTCTQIHTYQATKSRLQASTKACKDRSGWMWEMMHFWRRSCSSTKVVMQSTPNSVKDCFSRTVKNPIHLSIVQSSWIPFFFGRGGGHRVAGAYPASEEVKVGYTQGSSELQNQITEAFLFLSFNFVFELPVHRSNKNFFSSQASRKGLCFHIKAIIFAIILFLKFLHLLGTTAFVLHHHL